MIRSAVFVVIGLLGSLAVAAPPDEVAANRQAAAAFVPMLSQDEAWKALPSLEHGQRSLLPGWALATVKALPQTTAAMLELDYLHRVKSPLDAVLRAKVRWAVARANACAYAEAVAGADLRRAGLDGAAVAALAGNLESLPAEDREILAFARKLTLASQTVTDDEVAALMKRFGNRQLVALVQHIAHANFQDRLLLALGVARHDETPLPAMAVRFRRPPLGASLAQPRGKPAAPARSSGFLKPDAEWRALDLDTLSKEMESQKSRRPRIGLSSPERDAVVHWGEVCRKYQPEHAGAWAFCMRTFGAESYQDPVMEASVLWVVTRTQRSFY